MRWTKKHTGLVGILIIIMLSFWIPFPFFSPVKYKDWVDGGTLKVGERSQSLNIHFFIYGGMINDSTFSLISGHGGNLYYPVAPVTTIEMGIYEIKLSNITPRSIYYTVKRGDL